MQFLDRTGVGTLWSMCKTKFALAGHTHNYAGSGSPGGSANSAIGVVDYNQTGKTIQIGYSGTGITGDQIKYIAGYTDGSGNVNAKIKDVSKDALKSWLGLGSLAYSSSSIPTKLSQLNNDKGFVTGSVSGNTVTINGSSTTWTNTWRGIQDNLTSSSASESLSANQGKILKGLIDSKANSVDLDDYTQKYQALHRVWFNGGDDGKQYLRMEFADGTAIGGDVLENADSNTDGCMSKEDKVKLDGIASGANNYTLPTASGTTLGGVKVNAGSSEYKYPVVVDKNGFAYTEIEGLGFNEKGIEFAYFRDMMDREAVYSVDNITIGYNEIVFPEKSGIFALLSDIPNVSNLCRFNFVNSISECKSDRINFLFRCPDTLINLDPFDTYPDGAILLISISETSANIKHQSGRWYFNGESYNEFQTVYASRNQIILVTKNKEELHCYDL